MIGAVVCKFQRKEGSVYERGFAITRGIGVSDVVIIDLQLKQPENVWSYELLPFEGAIAL